MHFQSFLLILQLLVINVFGSPAKPSVSELFTSTNIPFQCPLDPTLYNLTRPLPSDLKTPRRAINLGYLLYRITFDGRNQGNPVPFVVSGTLLITQGVPTSATTNGRNPYDIVIFTGAPVTNPVAGALRYASNRYLYRFISGTNANSVLDLRT
jgi:hypothetical protein